MDISHAGSNAPTHVEPTKHVEGSDRKFGAASNDVAASLASSSFTTFFTWRGNGVHPRLRFAHSAINPNSRVFVSLSEFSSDARINRFIGAAKMTVSNVAPGNGEFFAWVHVDFGIPLNVRFDVLVEP